MNADSLARWYRWIEYAAYGRALERARFAYLPRLAHGRRILVLGEGDGRTLQKLLQVAPHAHVDVIESSERMIALASLRLGSGGANVQFHHIDALHGPWPGGPFDAILTHFFLDCFGEDQLRTLVPLIMARMSPAGLWLVADFAIPEKGGSRWHATILVRIMYLFFRLATGLKVAKLPNITNVLHSAGMHLSDRTETRWGLIRTEAWVK